MQFTVIFACFFFIKFIEYDQAVDSMIIIYHKHSFDVTQTDYNAQCIFFSLVIVTSISRLNKTEALINSQWMLISSLCND